MAITTKTVTGKIVIPGTTVGVRAKVTATPLTEASALTFPADDTISWGPVVTNTNSAGILTPGLVIPTNPSQTGVLWRIDAAPTDKHVGVPASWTLGQFEITGTGTIDLADMTTVAVTAVPASANPTDVVVGGFIDNPASVTTTAFKNRLTAVDADAGSTFRVQQDARQAAPKWAAAQAVTVGTVRQAPDGSWIKSTAARTTGAAFDATEQTFWTAVAATAGTIEQAALLATFVPRDGTDPGEGGFWDDLDAGVKIARLRDRLFVGDAAALPGVYTAAEGSVGEYFPFSRWMARESTAVVASGIGRIAVTGLSRATLSPTSPAAAPPAHTVSIGVVGFSYSDVLETESATRVVNGWGGYFEGVKRSGGQATFGVEIDVGNLGGGTATNNPYVMFGNGGAGGTYGLVVASGGSTGLVYEDTTFGIAVTNNGAKTKVGLIFEADAITGTDGITGTGNAIQLAKGHLVEWRTPESGGPQGAYLFSSVALAANRVGVEMTDNIVRTLRDGAIIGTVEHGGGASASANYVRLLSNAAGSPARVWSGGEANAGIDVQPSGTGTGRLAAPNGTFKVLWNSTGLGFFGTTPIAKQTLAAAATDAATTQTLVNDIRAKLIAYGLTA